jgi:VWFA-related protein
MQIEGKPGDWHFVNLLSAVLLFVLLPANCIAQSTEPTETLRVDSDLVDLKISVVSLNPLNRVAELQQKDFLVLEDGLPQQISFFAAAAAPFDLVLLLDLSGSTADKLKLIRKSAKRFVDATRPLDRVAIVTFTDAPYLVSPLTWDRERLKSSIDDIEKPHGGTNFWDSLRYVLETLLSSPQASRRSAIVLMTDGVDNALPDVYGEGSRTNFAELLNIVRQSNAILFPIYLDTENEEVRRHRTPRSAYPVARDQLAQLAEACGTTVYRANRLKDLDAVYEQVIRDLGTVYSIGYRPANTLRDGKWRNVTVQLLDYHEVSARTKRGYFAKAVDGP